MQAALIITVHSIITNVSIKDVNRPTISPFIFRLEKAAITAVAKLANNIDIINRYFMLLSSILLFAIITAQMHEKNANRKSPIKVLFRILRIDLSEPALIFLSLDIKNTSYKMYEVSDKYILILRKKLRVLQEVRPSCGAYPFCVLPFLLPEQPQVLSFQLLPFHYRCCWSE